MDTPTILALVVSAISALFAFYNSRWWPAKQKEREEGLAHERKKSSDAFSQVLAINQELIHNLIERSKLEYKLDSTETVILSKLKELELKFDARLDDVDDALAAELKDIKASLALLNTRDIIRMQDKERIDEILGDIDMILNRIETALKVKGGVQ